MHIIQLEAKNVKRIRAVNLKFDEDQNLFVIGGENDQGKSSVLDAILFALAGGSEICEQPIRNGESKAETTVTLGGSTNGDIVLPLKVTRKFTSKGTSLEIKCPDGSKLTSPQKILDALFSRFTFDPLKFTELGRVEQANVLRELVGLDFSELDEERETAFTARTELNRQKKTMAAAVESLPFCEGAPEEERSISALMEELRIREEHNAMLAEKHSEVYAFSERIDRKVSELEAAEQQIVRMRKELESLNSEANIAEAQFTELEEADDGEIRKQLEGAEETNAKVRNNNARKIAQGSLDKAESQAELLTAKIQSIDEDKRSLLAGSKWPVEGLGFGDVGITFEGLPFDQASSSDQLRVGVAMGFAANPELKLLFIRDSSLLGDKKLAMVAKLAAKYGGQVIAERVGQGKECSVIIEDGSVLESEPAAA